MNRSFTIDFNFDLAVNALKPLPLQASVELHHSVPYYKISRVTIRGRSTPSPILPDLDLLCIKAGTENKWVHKDSFQETHLSKVIGQAIEATGHPVEIAADDDLRSNFPNFL